jgi:hypothetical protein
MEDDRVNKLQLRASVSSVGTFLLFLVIYLLHTAVLRKEFPTEATEDTED